MFSHNQQIAALSIKKHNIEKIKLKNEHWKRYWTFTNNVTVKEGMVCWERQKSKRIKTGSARQVAY